MIRAKHGFGRQTEECSRSALVVVGRVAYSRQGSVFSLVKMGITKLTSEGCRRIKYSVCTAICLGPRMIVAGTQPIDVVSV